MPFELVYTAIDDSGERGTTSINLPIGFQIAQYLEFAVGMATFLDALLGGKVEGADICFTADISTLTSNVALSTSDVKEIGAFAFNSSAGFPVVCNVPCLDELTVVSGSDDIDQTDVNVAAFINAMLNGISTSGGTISPSDVAESDLVTLRSARERFRASGSRR